MAPNRKFTRTALVMALALLSAVLVASAAPAEEATTARGMAYGVRDNIAKVETPKVKSVVPPLTASSDENRQVDVFGVAQVASVESDACIQSGTPAKLQQQMDTAEFLAKGGAGEPPTVQTGTVKTPPNYPEDGNCFVPTDDKPEGDDNPPCADFDPATHQTCITNKPLWNGRGYAKALDLMGSIEEVQAEAVARCDANGVTEFATGAAYTLAGDLQGDASQPNQNLNPLALGLAESSTVIFWETNWDPATGTTTDGSDTVYVNGMHIITPTEDIIISHAEASSDCFQEGPPPGGFPRDISLTASKKTVTYGNTFSLTGSVTPATAFATPNSCVEGVEVTIRKDPVGAPQEFKDVGTVKTDRRGNFGFNVSAESNAQWLAFIAKDNPTDCAQSSSQSRSVLVRPFVGLKVSDPTPKRGSLVRLTTRVAPCGNHSGMRIKLRREYEGRSVKIGTKRLDSNCRAVFTLRANWKVAVFDTAFPRQDDDHQNGTSRPKVIKTH
jgi:hypothetical protein